MWGEARNRCIPEPICLKGAKVKQLVRLLSVLALLAAVSLIAGAQFQRDPQAFHFKWQLTAEAPMEVRVESARRGRLQDTIEAPGEVEAEVEVEVSAEVPGRIDELPVREGNVVSKGTPLVKLDSSKYDAKVRMGEARIRSLTAAIGEIERDLEKARRDVQKNSTLQGKGAVSSTEVADMQTILDKSLARLVMAKENMREAQESVVEAQEEQAKTRIASPVDGVVSRLNAEQGETVVIGTMNNPGTVIMVVSDMTTMIVRARIDETDVPLVKPGQKARIHLQFDEELTLWGKIKRVTPKGLKKSALAAGGATNVGDSNEVATFETIISIDSPPPQVRLGMTANVEILVEERDDVLHVPAQAVVHRRAKDLPAAMAAQLEAETVVKPGRQSAAQRYHQVVFVANQGRAEVRLVKTGISDETRVEIVEGLKAGEAVIAGPYRIFDKLKDGKSIKEMTDEEKGTP